MLRIHLEFTKYRHNTTSELEDQVNPGIPSGNNIKFERYTKGKGEVKPFSGFSEFQNQTKRKIS